MIKVLIADDQKLMRQSIKYVLDGEEDIVITDLVENGQEVIRSVRREKPDVILMDIRMPKMDGVQCTKIIKENYPEIKIIILTTFDDDEYVLNALRDGASGYLLKGISMEELIDAIHKVNNGNAMINPDVTMKVVGILSKMTQCNLAVQVNEMGIEDLGKTEWQVIRYVSKGFSNKEIALEMSLSEGTVRNYLSVILSKLNLRDRTQLAIWAVQTGAVIGNK